MSIDIIVRLWAAFYMVLHINPWSKEWRAQIQIACLAKKLNISLSMERLVWLYTVFLFCFARQFWKHVQNHTAHPRHWYSISCINNPARPSRDEARVTKFAWICDFVIRYARYVKLNLLSFQRNEKKKMKWLIQIQKGWRQVIIPWNPLLEYSQIDFPNYAAVFVVSCVGSRGLVIW